MPKISVISAAFNMERVFSFRTSIESVLKQSFFDIEFIICDDGSLDNTYSILCEYAKRDSRVWIFRNKEQRGLAYSLNRCLEYASGELIARHDLDDVSHKDRLLRQYLYLRKNPDISVLGTAVTLFNRKGEFSRRYFPERVSAKDFLFSSPYMHGSVVIRRDTVLAVGGYKVSRITRRTEDYELFMRLALISNGANLEEPLYYYLEDENTRRRRKYKYRIDEMLVRAGGFRALGLMPKALPYVIKPIVVGLIPSSVLEVLKRRREEKKYGTNK